MTDRVSYLVVGLEHDTRVDDVEGIVSAISQLRGVGQVTLGKPVRLEDHIARQQVGLMVAEELNKISRDLIAGIDPRAS